MSTQKHNIYLSASWNNNDKLLTESVTKLLVKTDLIILGDHPDFKSEKHERGLDYPGRVNEIMKDCSGVVVILPKRENKHTTSPYILLEILIANSYNLPMLILHEDSITLDVKNDGESLSLNFGHNQSFDKQLHFSDLEENHLSNKSLETTFSLRLDNSKGLIRIHPLQINNQLEIEEMITLFCKQLIPKNSSYVFNIIPFSMEEQYLEIKRTVFETTGMECFCAKDFFNEAIPVRKKWINTLENAKFIIADITDLRENCIYEVGVAHGKEIETYIINKGDLEKIPFGMDNMPIRNYKSNSELKNIIIQICKPYKRKVYNCDLKSAVDVNGTVTEFEDSVTVEKVGLKLLGLGLLYSISLMILGTTLLPLYSENKFLNNGVPWGIPLFTAVATGVPTVQRFLEGKLISKSKTLTTTGVILLVISIVISIII